MTDGNCELEGPYLNINLERSDPKGQVVSPATYGEVVNINGVNGLNHKLDS